MKYFIKYFCATLFLISISIEIEAQEADTIKATKFEFEFQTEDLLKWSVWRTDLYICTGIAFAKENNISIDDFKYFVAKTHSYTWGSFKGKGLTPIVQGLIWYWKSYQNSNLEIISQSDSIYVIRLDKPYKKFFHDEHLLNVSISEYEEVLFGHLKIMLADIGIDSDFKIESDFILTILAEKDKKY